MKPPTFIVNFRGQGYWNRFSLPVANAADVDVHEIRVSVIADSASMKRYCSVSQSRRGDAGDPDINCHRLHVEAVKGHSVSVCAEVFITPGGAIAADYIDFEIRIAERGSEIVQEIEDPRIIGANIARTVIAQIVAQPIKRFPVVSVAIAVDDVEALSCMGMEKVQLVRTSRGGLRFCLCRRGAHQAAG
jgi:hypothetical protein